MEKKQMTYFEIIEHLEEILPPTTEFDYTQISPEDLWQRVLNFINETNISISKDKLKDIESIFKNKISYLYKKDTHLLGWTKPNETNGFDQNHYFIKDSVIYLKKILMKEIYKEKIINKDAYLKEQFGEESHIRKHISTINIKNYISNMLMITAEKGDRINIESPIRWAEQIFLYFGLELPQYYDDIDPDYEELSKIANLLEDLFRSSLVYHGQSRQGDFGIEYASSSIDMKKFSENARIAINRIVEYIHERCQLMLQKGIKINELNEERSKNSSLINNNPKKPDKAEVALPPVAEEAYYEIKAMYAEMERLIAENKRIAEQLAKLKREEKRLMEELEKNNAKLIAQMPRGSK